MWIPIIYLNHDVLITFQEKECVQKHCITKREWEKMSKTPEMCDSRFKHGQIPKEIGFENCLTIRFAT